MGHFLASGVIAVHLLLWALCYWFELLEFWLSENSILLPLLSYDPKVSEMKILVFNLYKGKLLRSKEEQGKDNGSIIHFLRSKRQEWNSTTKF